MLFLTLAIYCAEKFLRNIIYEEKFGERPTHILAWISKITPF